MRDKRKKPFYIERGDVYMADLGSEAEVVGSEQSGVRPIVVTQCNRQNEKSPTIIIAILTSQIKKERMDPHVILPKVKGLWKSSMVCAEQRRTIDKSRLIRYCCTLDETTMKEITRACHKAEAPDEQKKRFW